MSCALITSRRILLIAPSKNTFSVWWQRYQRIYRAQQSWHGYDSTRLHRRVYRRRNRNTTQEIRREEDFIRLREGLTRINVKVKPLMRKQRLMAAAQSIATDELEALYKQLDALTRGHLNPCWQHSF